MPTPEPNAVKEAEEIADQSRNKTEIRTDKKEWADLLKMNRMRSEECTLSFTPPSVHNGVLVAKLKPDSVAKEADRWKNALLGCVYGLEPRFKKIESFALNRWKDIGLLSVHMIKENLFLFLFDSEDSKLQVFLGAQSLLIEGL